MPQFAALLANSDAPTGTEADVIDLRNPPVMPSRSQWERAIAEILRLREEAARLARLLEMERDNDVH
jgi:hypothetical protein